MPTQTLTGSCLCNKVRYSVRTELIQFYLCHCTQCRKITGSAFAANIRANPANIEWLSGFEFVKRFDYPGERFFTKVFCTECGSGLPFINEKGDSLYIPAGSLDSDTHIKPDSNIFWGDRCEWIEEGLSAPRYDGFD